MVSLSKKPIENVFRDTLDSVRIGKRPNIFRAMIKHGYSPKSAKAMKVTKTKTWDKLKAKYLNDEIALLTFNELAGAENEDKDNRLKASVEIMKLNDRYPAGKIKLGAFEDRDKVLE